VSAARKLRSVPDDGPPLPRQAWIDPWPGPTKRGRELMREARRRLTEARSWEPKPDA